LNRSGNLYLAVSAFGGNATDLGMIQIGSRWLQEIHLSTNNNLGLLSKLVSGNVGPFNYGKQFGIVTKFQGGFRRIIFPKSILTIS